MIDRQWYEANKHLVTMKQSTRYPELYVLKYKRDVFFKNLWTEEIEQCRGLIVDQDFNVVVRPFRKIFNYMENGTTFDRDAMVTYTRKINGFMCSVTLTQNNSLLVSTTGSLDSDYVKMAQTKLDTAYLTNVLTPGYTHLFEICHENDPHIIIEKSGAYYIGCVRHSDGYLAEEASLDSEDHTRFRSQVGKFSDVVKLSKEVQHEGFVVRLASDQQQALKIKSPYYLIKKFFARKSVDKLNKLLDNPAQAKQYMKEEEYFPLVDYLCNNKVAFSALDEQQRLRFIEEFLHDN